MIKLQDFAKECGVTDRQVQRLVNKYEAELEGHFERRGVNGTWLDEEGCVILRGKMKVSPVSFYDPEQESEIQQLKATIAKLEERLDIKEQYIMGLEINQTQKQDRINELEGQIGEVKLLAAAKESAEKEITVLEGFIKDAKAEIEIQKAQNADLSAERDKAIQKTLEAEKKAQEASEELEKLKNRSFWQRLRNK